MKCGRWRSNVRMLDFNFSNIDRRMSRCLFSCRSIRCSITFGSSWTRAIFFTIPQRKPSLVTLSEMFISGSMKVSESCSSTQTTGPRYLLSPTTGGGPVSDRVVYLNRYLGQLGLLCYHQVTNNLLRTTLRMDQRRCNMFVRSNLRY